MTRADFRSYARMSAAIGDARLTTYILSREDRAWHLSACRLGPCLLQRGVDGAPHVTTGRLNPGRVAFLLTGSASAVRFCNGHEVDAGSLFAWGAAADVAVQVPKPGDWTLLSSSSEEFSRAAAEAGLARGEVATGPVNATPEKAAGFRGLLENAWAVIERAGPAGLPAEEADRLGETLLRIAAHVSLGDVRSPRRSRRLRVDRGRIVSRVEEILDGLLAEPVYVPALGAALGVPERTLRYLFAEQYGAGPVEVVRSRRLCQVHRALLDALPGTRIGEVASRFGFRHLGQFAADYRALLGESPSETHRRALAGSDVAALPGRWAQEWGVPGELAAV